MIEGRAFFEDLIDRHSQQIPPYRISVFSREEAANIKAYADKTFFRYYKMYAFAYLQKKELVVQCAFERVAPAVPAPARLEAAHEVDPKDVPELEELFVSSAANTLRGEELSAAAATPILEQSLRSQSPFAG